ELRFPYHPHVTIAHELDEATLYRAAASMGDFDAVFPVVHFSLYFRGADGVWRDTVDFALTSCRRAGVVRSRPGFDLLGSCEHGIRHVWPCGSVPAGSGCCYD